MAYLVEIGWLNGVKFLLEKGVKINVADHRNGSAFCVAVERGDFKMMDLLIKHGADVNFMDEYWVPLECAAERQDIEVVRHLLSKGADVKVTGAKALMKAASRGKKAVVALLLAKGVDVNSSARSSARGSGFYDTPTTALAEAAYSNHLDIAELLLRKGADPELQFHYGTPLFKATSGGHVNMVKLLLQYGADPKHNDSYWGTALQNAVANTKYEIMKLLIDSGADINSSTGYYASVLCLAAGSDDCALVKFLLKKGAKGISDAFQYAVQRGKMNTAKLLLREGADTNYRKPGGASVLESAAACRENSVGVVRLLLANGAAIDSPPSSRPRSWEGTPLQRACSCGNVETVRLLLKRGANVNAEGPDDYFKKGGALEFAAAQGHTLIVKELLAYGANLQPRDPKHLSALQVAAENGYEDIVQMLLDADADPNYSCTSQDAPLQRAIRQGKMNIIEKLIRSGATVLDKSRSIPALKQALEKGHIDVFQLIYKNHGNNFTNEDIENLIISAVEEGHTSIISTLLKKKPRESCLNTCLFKAAGGGFVEIIELLLLSNADPYYQRNDGTTALHIAASKGHWKVVNKLLAGGVDLDIVAEDYGTALHAAASHYGEHWSIENGEGVILSNRYEETVRILLEAGADINALDSEEKTALEKAKEYGQEDTVQLLCKHGASE